MEQLVDSKFKTFYNNSNFILNPLIGGINIDTIEDFYGLLITASYNQINFYVLTPHQYFLIFSISTEIKLINLLIFETLSDDSELKKQHIRKLLFQDNDLINYNVGIKENIKMKIADINFFELNLKKEIFCFGDNSGNLAIYK